MSKENKKKMVLEEGTMRRWMEISGQSHLVDSALAKLQEGVLHEEEELPPEGGEMPPPADLPAEAGPDAGLSLDPAAVEQLVKVIADAISSATGTPVDVSGGAEAPAPEGDLPPPAEEEAPLQEKVDAKAFKGDMKDQEYKKAKASKKNAGPLEEEVVEESGETLEEEVVEEEVVEESAEDLMESVVSKVMSRVLEELKKRK